MLILFPSFVLPVTIDRKTDQLFSVKDFIFSHEPSSWRFDVPEELNGHPQVVDFTDDTTGAPHDVARAHMSMYVNEVGHNMNLVENVSVSFDTGRKWFRLFTLILLLCFFFLLLLSEGVLSITARCDLLHRH